MRIAVCITNRETVGLLPQLFELYQEQRDMRLSCRYFKNALDLLGSFVPGDYDVLFYGGTGSECMAEEIEQRDGQIQFVCVAPVGADTGAAGRNKERFYRLPEPMDEYFLLPMLDRLAAEIHQNYEAGLVVRMRGRIIHFLFSQIEYVEITGRTLSFHLLGERVEEVSGTFSDYEARLLQWPDFYKVHRAFIVNLRHIEKLTADGVLTRSGRTVPVSRNLYAGLKQEYLSGFRVLTASMPARHPDQPVADGDAKPPCAVLLVDDEETERMRWSKVLADRGCAVCCADCGEEALALARRERFDCVVLDVRLGSDCGFDLCGALTDLTGAPVIYLSSLSDSENQMKGFAAGGIDYITKDTPAELFWAKVDTRIRMSKAAVAQLVSGSLRLDLKLRRAYMREQDLSLTAVEFDILYLLMQNPGISYEPERIYELIWGGKQRDDGHTVSLHLSQLCRKLDSVSPCHGFVDIAWGAGCRFVPQE